MVHKGYVDGRIRITSSLPVEVENAVGAESVCWWSVR